MKQGVEERTKDSVSGEQCHHYWEIEIANGPKSQGVCKYCGETRDFLNSITYLVSPKRKSNPLDLPRIPKVKLDKESKS